MDVTVQNPPTFPCFPPSIWTPGGGSFFLRLSTSCTVSKRDLDLFLLDLHLSSKSARSQSIPALRVHRLLMKYNFPFGCPQTHEFNSALNVLLDSLLNSLPHPLGFKKKKKKMHYRKSMFPLAGQEFMIQRSPRELPLLDPYQLPPQRLH